MESNKCHLQIYKRSHVVLYDHPPIIMEDATLCAALDFILSNPSLNGTDLLVCGGFGTDDLKDLALHASQRGLESRAVTSHSLAVRKHHGYEEGKGPGAPRIKFPIALKPDYPWSCFIFQGGPIY